MGYITKDIIKKEDIIEPAKVSLGSNPNFFEINVTKKEAGGDNGDGDETELSNIITKITRLDLGINADYDFDDGNTYLINATPFYIEDLVSGERHYFKGRPDEDFYEDLGRMDIIDADNYNGYSVYPMTNMFDSNENMIYAAMSMQLCMVSHPFFVNNNYRVWVDEDTDPKTVQIRGNADSTPFKIVYEHEMHPSVFKTETITEGEAALSNSYVELSFLRDIFDFVYMEIGGKGTVANSSAFSILDLSTGERHYFKGKPCESYINMLEHMGIEDGNVYDGFNLFETGYNEDNLEITTINLVYCLANHPFFTRNGYNVSMIGDFTNKLRIRGYANSPAFEIELLNASFSPVYAVQKVRGEAPSPSPSVEAKGFTFEVIDPAIDESKSKITLKRETDETSIELKGTKTRDKVNSTTFFLDEDKSISAENIRTCMMQHSSLSSNFNISVPPVEKGNRLSNGSVIHITAKGIGKAYNLTVEVADPTFVKKEGQINQQEQTDTLLGESDLCEVQLDIYKNTGIPLGKEGLPSGGLLAASLTKAYYGRPLWFDVNALWSNSKIYSNQFLTAAGWCDAGTVQDFRFVAKRFDGCNTETFFRSDVFYTLTGFCRNLNKNNLDSYIYSTTENNVVKPLSNCTEFSHIKGQKQYFNFVLSHNPGNVSAELGLQYTLYTQSGRKLATQVLHNIPAEELHVVNTISLSIDALSEAYPATGIVKVQLWCNGHVVSQAQTYKVLPPHLHKVNDFAFLNALGGWSSFNFGGDHQTDFKTDGESIFKTQTPDYTISSEIESVFNKDVTEEFTAYTSPITASVADWLKEMSASPAVYELSTGRYVLIDDLNVKHSTKDDLFTLQMKYHYSDSYNARIK
ncbi:hypothetical protein [Dysgonomonas sp. 511]|uniref:hypothetical protein n=1 Tax=Dysgonomonas sp. 511 TaxID=2302930 RepID=UPI0013D86BD2|nr:hypothetical protein [Dysgonomonas sp. 511]NDV79322.1 hypothetical protein [Dysgonomonas sp. 511]